MTQLANPELLNTSSVLFGDQTLQEHHSEEKVLQSLNKSEKVPLNQSETNNRHLLRRIKGYDTFRSNEGESFTKTSTKLFERSFSHHHPNSCVCEECNCGRHLCDFKNNLKPDLTKTTIYKQSYEKKRSISNRVNRPTEYNKFHGPHLDIASNYQKEYDGKQGDVNHKVKPEDLLKTGGPFNFLTSYSSGFPGHRGDNQYIKPIERSTIIELPMMSKTTYMRSFMPQLTERTKIQKTPDNLRASNMWMGRSTYDNFYRHPNPEDYAKKNKMAEKLNNIPNYEHQYETTYGKSFMGSMPTICPAKATLETKSKGFFSGTKDKFTENTDYKSLDPTFHAISTSKHSYA